MASDRLKDLNDLETAFRQWRRNKQRVTERVPAALAEQVGLVAAAHGVPAVARVAGSAGRRIALQSLRTQRRPQAKAAAPTASPPPPVSVPAPPLATSAYSRIQLPAPQAPAPVRTQATATAVLEVETPQGLKVRVFSTEPGALAWVRDIVGTSKKEPTS